MDYYIKTKLNLALNLKEAGDYTGAEEAIREGLERDPFNNFLLTSLADLYTRMDRLDEAFSLAEEVLGREVDNQRALIVKGDISLKRKKYAEGADYFKNALYVGQNSYIYKRLIQALIKNRQFSQALEICLEVRAKQPDNITFLKLIGLCYKKLKFYKEAVEIYGILIEKYPDDNFIYKDYIELKTSGKTPEERINEIDGILKVHPFSENIQLRLFHAGNLKKAGRFNEAVEQYKIALNISPGDVYILKQLGFCYLKMDSPEMAVSILSPFFLKDPLDYYVKTTLLAAYKKISKLDDFLRLIDKAIRQYPHEKKLLGFKKKVLNLF